MSGGPPSHHSHGIPTNAWNHLQIPNYFPGRQPQHAHMSSEHPLLHQPTWHTPTTEPVKTLPHSHIFNLEQMLNTRHSPGVDLSLATTRNGQNTNNQNGELHQAPISLSVRDARQINSLPMGALDTGEITKKTPISPLNAGNKKVDSSTPQFGTHIRTESQRLNSPALQEKPTQSVIVSTATNSSSHDENSNSSNTMQEDEDSLDNNKSRRKRKPFKTVRLTPCNREEMESGQNTPKPPSVLIKEPELEIVNKVEASKVPENVPTSEVLVSTAKSSKCSPSELVETSIAPMEIIGTSAEVPQSGEELSSNPAPVNEPEPSNAELDMVDSSLSMSQTASPPADVSENAPTPQKDTQTTFVAVEDELEKMFAGIAETKTPSVPLEVPSTSSQPFDGVTSTSSENANSNEKASHKRGRPKGSKNNSRRSSTCNSVENTPKKKHKGSKKKLPREESPGKTLAAVNKALMSKNNKKSGAIGKKNNLDNIRDVYAYDSGSNTSSTKSKGPFIQIRGPRDSPISVNIVNGPSNDDEHSDKKSIKPKKFHDDSEYRHKVRSKGLHCSTLSNKYDAQTKDVTWICVFCKRGPHAAEPTSDPNLMHLQMQYSPGDLFGPYIITTDCSEYQRRINDPFDLLFKSKKAVFKACANPCSSSPKKVKRKHNDSESTDTADVYDGMTEASSNSYEVWTHEECVIWSPGVYLVGPKIVGLEGAVWGSCSVPCGRCGMKGAVVCCLQRGCNATMHVGCARLAQWQLDEETYKTYCNVHTRLALGNNK